MTYCFVGERQSPLAAARGWHWQDGRVCAGTLQRALLACGIEPSQQVWLNLWDTPGIGPCREPPAVAVLVERAAGRQIVALGRLVHRELERASVEHVTLTHPAARGAIRATEVYQEHVRAVLAQAVAS